MRRLIQSILLLSFVTVLSVPQAVAQQKIGYVNTDTILEQFPEYNGIQQQLEVLSRDWRDQLEQMKQRIDTLKADFKAKEILYSDEVKAQKQQQIQQLQQARQQYLDEKFGARGAFFSRQKELLEPIQRKIYSAITSVSEQQDIDFVFDRAKNSSLLFGRNQWNLNQDVLQELGITLNN